MNAPDRLFDETFMKLHLISRSEHVSNERTGA